MIEPNNNLPRSRQFAEGMCRGYVLTTVNHGAGCVLPSILVDTNVRHSCSYAASLQSVRCIPYSCLRRPDVRGGCEPLNHYDRISNYHANPPLKRDPDFICCARRGTLSKSYPRRKSRLIHTLLAELPRRTSMWIVISLLFSLTLVPIFSQSIFAQQTSPTASPSVAANDH